jgi:hypothetical protein
MIHVFLDVNVSMDMANVTQDIVILSVDIVNVIRDMIHVTLDIVLASLDMAKVPNHMVHVSNIMVKPLCT